MPQVKEFECGCQFELNERGGLIFNLKKINYNCPATFDLISRGETIGCFQIESNLCRHWCKQIQPDSIYLLAVVLAIVRPGILKSFTTTEEGKRVSNADYFLLCKNGLETPRYLCEQMRPILEKTHGTMVFQEQILEIAKVIAGYSLLEADSLRKAIGKKLAQLLAENRSLFVKKTVETGYLNEEDATTLFDIIEKSNRYLFNLSHAIGYAYTAYDTAYLKTHFPNHFLRASLAWSCEDPKPHEVIRPLVGDCRKFNLNCYPPSILDLSGKDIITTHDEMPIKHFYIKGDGIYFGLADVKDISENAADTIKKLINQVETKLGRSLEKWSWLDFLLFACEEKTDLSSGRKAGFTSTVVKRLIGIGALHFRLDRGIMEHEYARCWSELTDKEKGFAQEKYLTSPEKYKCLADLLEDVAPSKKDGGGASNKNRTEILRSIIQLLRNPPANLADTSRNIAQTEYAALGVALTCNALDGREKTMAANITCLEFSQGAIRKPYNYILAAEIKRMKLHQVKNGDAAGRDMAFLTIDDGTAELDNVVVFASDLENVENKLFEGATVLLCGTKDDRKGGFIVKNVVSI